MRSLDLLIQNKSPQARNFLLMNRMAGKGVTKVVNKCKEAQEDQKLDLSECMLMSFPDAVYHLMRTTTVLTCNLSFNQLRKFPAKIAVKFSFITDLNLSHNKLSSLPEELKEMADLQKLNLSHNDFILFPCSVYSSPRITHLNVSHNKISDVDAKIMTSIKTLKEVDLGNNPLSLKSHTELSNVKSTRLHIHVTPVTDDLYVDLDDLDD